MNITTLADLRLRCRERADKINSAFVSDAELTRLINVKFAKLWNFLATQYIDLVVLPPKTLTVTANQEWLSLPSDFMQCIALYGLDGTTRVKLRQFNMEDLSTEQFTWGFEYDKTETIKYRIMGRRLYLMPDDHELDELEMWYIPVAPALEADADVLPFDLPSGWDECIVNGVAALIKIKEEADPTFLLGLETQCYKELEAYAADRDASRPARVVDMELD